MPLNLTNNTFPVSVLTWLTDWQVTPHTHYWTVNTHTYGSDRKIVKTLKYYWNFCEHFRRHNACASGKLWRRTAFLFWQNETRFHDGDDCRHVLRYRLTWISYIVSQCFSCQYYRSYIWWSWSSEDGTKRRRADTDSGKSDGSGRRNFWNFYVHWNCHQMLKIIIKDKMT